jgi:two-component system chemotaxis sensor kinase CheA
MSLDRGAFVENFLAELEENIERIDASMIALKKDPEDEGELATLLRALHTIKGSSRMLKFLTIERLAHGLENVFKGVKDGRYKIDARIVQLVFLSTDFFHACAAAIAESGEDEIAVEDLVSVFERVYSNEPYSLESIRPPALPAAPARAAQQDASAEPAGAVSGGPSAPAAPQESIRINVRRIDEIIRLLNGLIIRQFQLKKQNDAMAELDRQIHQVEAALRERPEAGDLPAKMTACARQVQTLRKALLDELSQVEASTFEIQRQVSSLRMLPIELVLGTLGKMVEETAMRTGKEVDFAVRGADTLIDKMVLERIQDPIIHLVRNAIDHGVEPAAEREKAGKPRVAKISVTCTSESGNILVRVRDDGRGIDYDRVRAKAGRLFPHLESEMSSMDESSLNAFLFQPGFSTREEASELSGRGIGLDIVRANVERIKGKITLSSERGKGTEMVLSLPFSLATVAGFFVSSAGEKFLIPAGFVKEIVVARQVEEVTLPDRKAIKLRNRIIPVYALSDIVRKDGVTGGEGRFIVVAESLGESIGVIVDNVQQFSSLVYKPLPANLAALKAVQGIVFDESFNIVNILFVPEILNRFKRMKSIDTKKRFSPRQEEYRHILVVDDSLTTREIEKSILELENYNVETAVDGIEGLKKARERYFHLIVTDVHMPRMDGCTFVENLRKDEKYKTTPIIVISAVEDRETRARFDALGVGSYIVKSDFDRGNLANEVRRLIG